MLSVRGLRAGYGHAEVLHGVDIDVARGSVTCIVGPNGAGKTTLARAISSHLRCRAGRVEFDGVDITRARPDTIVRQGLVQVFEGRELFSELTVRENLELGGFAVRKQDRKQRAETLELVHDLFPRLEDRATQKAGTLSGGEQQMLAIGRALMSKPTLLLLDEPSLGLAPIIIEAISEALTRLSGTGITILLIDEDPQRALALADHGYVMVAGQVLASGPSESLKSAAHIELAYLGRLADDESPASAAGPPR
jgi:branched-chain amino acid transport system ATP-binding protein